MSAEGNKELVRRFVEEIPNGGHLERSGEFLHTDCVVHFPNMPDFKGLEEFKELPLMIRTAFPDLHETIDDLIAEDDKVVERFTLRATHQGDFMGAAPTGRPVSWTSLAVYRLAGGKIAEIWVEGNFLSLTLQVGAVSRTT
jgi:predicted ester cyclase